MLDKAAARICLHKNHDWMTLNELKHITVCRRCGLDRSEHQEEIYRIPLLVRREVGYAPRKDFF